MKIVNISEEQLKIAYEVAKQSFPARLSIFLEPLKFNQSNTIPRITLLSASSPFAENKNIKHWVKIEVSVFSEEKGYWGRVDLYSVDNYSDETYSSYESFRNKFDKVFSVAGVQRKVNERWSKYVNDGEEVRFQLIQEGGEEDAT